MSKSGNNKNIAQVTGLQKLAKVNARYLDMEQFRDSDLEVGYFSYNCINFMKPNHCAIVADDGVAPHHTAFVRYGNQINVK
jgi:hypothetical protein